MSRSDGRRGHSRGSGRMALGTVAVPVSTAVGTPLYCRGGGALRGGRGGVQQRSQSQQPSRPPLPTTAPFTSDTSRLNQARFAAGTLGTASAAAISDDRRLHQLESAVNRIRNNIDSQLNNHRHELDREGGGELVMRAQRLTQRLEILKRKLAMCFEQGDQLACQREEMALRSQGLLQEVHASRARREARERAIESGGNDEFEPYDPAAFLFAEEQANYSGGGASGRGFIRSTPNGPMIHESCTMTPQIVLEQMAAVEADDAPEDFVCPITQCIMVDPVFTADGSIYERAAISEWFRSFQSRGKVPTSPLTNLELHDVTLTPSLELRREIQKFLDASVQKQKEAVLAVKREKALGKEAPATIVDDDVVARSSTFEEPSLRQLGRSQTTEKAPVDDNTNNNNPSEAGEGRMSTVRIARPPPILSAPTAVPAGQPSPTSPTYDANTIDVGQLRRAFQKQQQEKEDREKLRRAKDSAGDDAVNRNGTDEVVEQPQLARTASLAALLTRHNVGDGPEGRRAANEEVSSRTSQVRRPEWAATSTNPHQDILAGAAQPSSNREALDAILGSSAGRSLDPAMIALLTRQHRGGGYHGAGDSDSDDDDVSERRLAATTGSQPIWGSSVVPLHEPNSRVLNLLRVREDFVEGIDDTPSGGPMLAARRIGGGSPGGLGGGQSRTTQRLRDATAAAASAASFPTDLYRVSAVPQAPTTFGRGRGRGVGRAGVSATIVNDDDVGITSARAQFRPPVRGLELQSRRLDASQAAGAGGGARSRSLNSRQGNTRVIAR